MSRYSRVFTVVAALAFCGCGDGKHGPTQSDDSNPFGIVATGPGVLSVSPLDTSTLVAVTPLGALAPPGHVLPTDHVYLYFVDPWSGSQQNNDCRARPVRAAGSGVISFVTQTESAGDTKVTVMMTRTFMYYYDHVILRAGIGVGTRVSAGDTIGTTTGRCPSIDLGVIDTDVVPAGFVNASRYGPTMGHAVSPYKYFAEPLRSLFYARVRILEGVPANKDGRIDYGIRGKLAGDWFHSTIAQAASSELMGPAGWPKTLAFVYDWFNGAPRISVGGSIAPAGVLSIGDDDADFGAVDVGSGLVAYRTTRKQGVISSGWMLVQMISDERIRVQYFPGASARPAAFTAVAHEFVR